MVKLKLNREQLYTLCGFTNPAVHEARANHCIEWQEFTELEMLFNLIQVGEMVSKKYLFTVKHKYNISLKLAEAASLLNYTNVLEQTLDQLSYEHNVMLIIRQALHFQITNFQRRFYGQPNRQNLLTGGYQSAGGALANTARYIGGGAD
ncbi:hypothetical protein [Mucilaginibacter sp.]|uniref:hypothetical protein n=1 Tax=Mucilaginibacter sp. TaxID=1882438 RepID=UPI000CB5A080|nr:hypothetical protein [Mucilaginibacter sp.]PLW90011.1 MAG: hypothetical protein C0154_08795 [Mucilaginibacter sp.]PMP65805.1 MAG: hypothetical protein C0191_02785 [Mucilaginibacter sp.]